MSFSYTSFVVLKILAVKQIQSLSATFFLSNAIYLQRSALYGLIIIVNIGLFIQKMEKRT